MTKKAYRLDELSHQLQATLHGDASCEIVRVAALHHATHGDIAYLENHTHIQQLKATQASAVILAHKYLADCPTNALVVDQPKLAFIQLLRLLHPVNRPPSGVHPSCVIEADCQIDASASIGARVVLGSGVSIGKNTVIAAGTVIGDHVKIGSDCWIHANVSIYPGVSMGARVIVHSGAVIGADGFGFVQNKARNWIKVPQIGGVVIGNDVEIGANTSIDRGALDNTVIEDGVKLDNQIMIAHNARIGAHSLLAGCVGVAGSTIIGKHCIFGGMTAVSGHLRIADNVVVTGAGMVTKSLSVPGVYSSGTGILPNKDWQKCAVRFRQLDRIAQRLKKLEQENDE